MRDKKRVTSSFGRILEGFASSLLFEAVKMFLIHVIRK